MSNSTDKHSLFSRRSHLSRWLYSAVRAKGERLRFRVKGNQLHLLYEGSPCPDRLACLKRLIPALQRTRLSTLLPDDHPPIYQVWLYGRSTDQPMPEWSYTLHLNQLDRHWQQVKEMQATRQVSVKSFASASSSKASTTEQRGGALVLSNRSLAKQGSPEAIARYLSETLSTLGVSVDVTVKTIPYQPKPNATLNTVVLNSATQRLRIVCQAAYSPDPMTLAEPLSRRLRDLELDNFRDAVISIQVVGEPAPDWALRVDLTPPKEMLREWARWGDVEAITRLCSQALAEQDIQLTTCSQKDSTLHLFCSLTGAEQSQQAPKQSIVRQILEPILDTLGPQGVHSATLYGQIAEAETPAWVEWLNLPASRYPDLADSPMTLAQKGDWDAIAFLLSRMLNPDLDEQLATGGIRLQMLQKRDLLHVMADGPSCPEQQQVGQTIARFLKQLELPGIGGVRVYGRRAGQKAPRWSFGEDFASRDRLVPEAPPEFAATDAYVGELMAERGELVHRPDLEFAPDQADWETWRQRTLQKLQAALVRSHIFTPAEAADAPVAPTGTGLKTVLVWAAVGVLLVFQGDRLLNAILQANPQISTADTRRTPVFLPPSPQPIPAAQATPAPATPAPAPATTVELPEISLQQTPANEATGFSAEGFTSPSPAQSPAAPQATVPSPTISAVIPAPAVESPLPTFNSEQFDKQIALYYEYIKQTGAPPDVLIIGSSRALRGIDPTMLRQELTKLGYEDVTLFNFGINGATAQVVDMVVRQLLTPAQLPRLIVLADGARAFNSGAVDVTYNGMAQSEGFQQLAAGTLAIPPEANPGATETAGDRPPQGAIAALKANYDQLDEWLSDRLGAVSLADDGRDRLKTLFQQALTSAFPQAPQPPDFNAATDAIATEGQPPLVAGEGLDSNGFLSLSVQFNPATYYQQYARVSGEYDSDYKDFRLEGRQVEALQSLLAYTQSRAIPVVLVNLPLTQDYLDPVRLRYEEEFRQFMIALDVNHDGLIFRDLGELWPTQHDFFSDPSHLNRYGAAQVSIRLAQDPIIPWIQATGGDR